jgi:hypothetical protein
MQKWDWLRFIKAFSASSIIFALLLFSTNITSKAACLHRIRTVLLASIFCWVFYSILDIGTKKPETSPAVILAYIFVNISFLLISYFHYWREK